MPYSRPNLATLRSQVANDIDAGLPGLDTLLRYANLRITGAAQAGLANGLYGYLDWQAKQMVPFTSTDEYLAGWAALRLIYIKEATAAAGAVTFNITDITVGPAIAAGIEITRSDGTTFLTSAGTISGSTIIVPVTAKATGADGNTAVGTTLYLSQGISGVAPQGTVTTALTGGADIETQDEFKSRMLQAYQKQPAGGSKSDYITWALAVPGVTRAWCVPRGYGIGTVVVYIMMDDVRADEGGFPQGTNGLAAADNRDTAATGDQLTAANAIFLVQPVNPRVYLRAPAQNTVSLPIAGIAPSDTLKAAILTAFTNALVQYGELGGTTDISYIQTAIAGVSGTAGFVITAAACTAGSVTLGAAGNIVSNAGALPVPGAIGYT